jgi:hypothetical protein
MHQNLKLWLLRRLVRYILTTFQLRVLMKMIHDEHEIIFYEDNEATRRAHILESMPCPVHPPA